MSLGDLDVACPGCGEELHVRIDASGPEIIDGEAVFTLHPRIPEHTCPPPPAREPIARAA